MAVVLGLVLASSGTAVAAPAAGDRGMATAAHAAVAVPATAPGANGASPAPAPADPNGAHTLTVLPITWGEPGRSDGQPFWDARTTAQFWTAQSGGRMTVTAHGGDTWVSVEDPGTCDPGILLDLALTAHGRPAPVDARDHVVVVHPERPDCAGKSDATLGGAVMWINGWPGIGHWARAFGRNLGLGDATDLVCVDATGAPVPYSDTCRASGTSDAMTADPFSGLSHLSAAMVAGFGWGDVVEAGPDRVVATALTSSPSAAGVRAVRVPARDGADLYVEYRPAVAYGVQVVRRTVVDGVPTTQRMLLSAGVRGVLEWRLDAGRVYPLPGTDYLLSLDGQVNGYTDRVRVVPAGLDAVAPEPATVTPPPLGWLASPRGVVRWTEAVDALAGVVAYEVLVDGEMVLRAGSEARSALVDLRPPSASIAVRAIDVAGNASTGPVVTLPVGTLPDRPEITSGVVGHEHVRIEWAEQAVVPAITGYTVTVDEIAVADPPVVLEVPPGRTWVELDGLRNGAAYGIEVRATNALGESAPGWAGQLTPWPLRLISPAYQENVGSSMRVAWEPAPGLGPIARYVVELDGRAVRHLPPEVTSMELPVSKTGDWQHVDVHAVLEDETVESSGETRFWMDDEYGPWIYTDLMTWDTFYAETFWLTQARVAGGYADGTFRPSAPVTRGAMAAFLHRVAGGDLLDDVEPVRRFSDVPSDHPFAREIDWLARSGVTSGYSDGTFGPAAPVSRGAMARFLHRFAALTSLAADDVPLEGDRATG